MPYTTICDTPAGARPSGSNNNRAKLLVPSGTPDQASGGDRFSPTQLGLRSLSAHAFLTANVPLSAICGEVSTSTSALAVPSEKTKPTPSIALARPHFILPPPCFGSCVG